MNILCLSMFISIQLIYVRSILRETIIDHNILKDHAFINAPKYWFHYIRQFLYNVISKHSYSIYSKDTHSFLKLAKQLLKKSKQINSLVPNCDDFFVSGKCSMKEPRPGVQIEYTVANRIYQSSEHGLISSSEEIIAPVGTQKVYRAIVSNVGSLIIHYRFIFKTQLQLRLNLTFHHIHILHGLKFKCEYDYLYIEGQMHCGLISNFVVFPFGKDIDMDIDIWKEHNYFDIEFAFSVIDPDRVTSEVPKRSDIVRFSSWIVYFPHTGLLLQRFIIKVKSFLGLKFVLRPIIGIEADVFDGPGLLCRKINPVTLNDTGIVNIYVTSSFQSVIYLRSYDSTGNINDMKNRLIDFKSHKRFISKTIFIIEDNLSYSADKYFGKKPVWTIKLQTKPWLYFNITIRNISHNHPESMLCSYGGVSVFDIVNGKHKDVSKQCYVHPRNYTYQNIYSNSSTAQIVIYSYREYGPFNVTLDITTTRCQVSTIDVCNVVSQGIKVNSCVIFQLKQKANQIFEENNLYSNWMFCQSYLTHHLFDKVLKEFFNVQFTGKKNNFFQINWNWFYFKAYPCSFITGKKCLVNGSHFCLFR